MPFALGTSQKRLSGNRMKANPYHLKTAAGENIRTRVYRTSSKDVLSLIRCLD